MSQVLQWTQFCALIWKRGSLPGLVVDDLVDAGRTIALFRLVVEAVIDRDRLRRVRSFRCAGWSSSWLVFEMNTEDSRSKLILPSGLG